MKKDTKPHLIDSTKLIDFDFSAPNFLITKQNRVEYIRQKTQEDPDYIEPSDEKIIEEIKIRICGLLVKEYVGAKYKSGGMPRDARREWAIWQELIESETITTQIPKFSIRWLKNLMTDPGLNISAAFAHAESALLNYLIDLENKEDVA